MVATILATIISSISWDYWWCFKCTLGTCFVHVISPGCRFGVHLFVVTVNGFTIVNFTPNVHTKLILAILGFSGTCVIKSVPILPWFHNWGNRPCPQTKANHRKPSSIIPLKQTKGFNPNYRFKKTKKLFQPEPGCFRNTFQPQTTTNKFTSRSRMDGSTSKMDPQHPYS